MTPRTDDHITRRPDGCTCGTWDPVTGGGSAAYIILCGSCSCKERDPWFERAELLEQVRSWQAVFCQVVEAKSEIVAENDHHRETLRMLLKEGILVGYEMLRRREPWLFEENVK